MKLSELTTGQEAYITGINGNGAIKKRINEMGFIAGRKVKAVKSVEDVSSADWNRETKILEVSFDESKTSVHRVQMAIAKVGHDTPMHKAKDKVYNALPGCCKYDRTEVKNESSGHEGHKH